MVLVVFEVFVAMTNLIKFPQITISRALAALTLFQKIKLAWQFLTCNEDIT